MKIAYHPENPSVNNQRSITGKGNPKLHHPERHELCSLWVGPEEAAKLNGENGCKNLTPLNLMWTNFIIRIRRGAFSSCWHQTVH